MGSTTQKKKLKQNILIVEDSEISRELLVSMLESEYQVYEAENGQQAIAMMEEKPEFYQLVLLDLHMPVLDGYGVLRTMKKRGWLKELPVIIISSEIGMANQMGAVDFFSKPFDRDIVLTRIRNVLAIYAQYVTDSLTGGLNRKGFIRLVENLFSSGVDKTRYDILFFDIKHFKAVNELIGFKNGDYVLEQFYKKLIQAEFEPLVTARIETDHFVCLTERKYEDYSYIENICQQNFYQNGKRFEMSVQCGIYQIDEQDVPVSVMIEYARMARGCVEELHAGSYVVYHSNMKVSYIDQAQLTSELFRGMEQGEFKVYYQPVMDAQSGELVSAEALVRWEHPEKGVIMPGDFIPILEKNGYISKLDMYMVREILKFQKKRYSAGLSVVPISVNLSGIDFYDEEIMQEIERILAAEEIPNWLLRFEITETSYTAMEALVMERIEMMRRQNVKILVDDFGKGYSSLGLLLKCNADILKVDREFIRQLTANPKTKVILRNTIDMAHELGLFVVAEGVETSEQLEFLQSCECDYIQGYYYSKPLPEPLFERMLSDCMSAEPIYEHYHYKPYFYQVGFYYTSSEMRKNMAIDSDTITDMLKSNDAVGVICGLYDERQTICYLCELFLHIAEMTFNDIREYTKGSYLKLVAPEDRERYLAFIEGTLTYQLMLPGEKRIKIRDIRTIRYTKDGKKQWLSSIRLFEDDEVEHDSKRML